MVCSAVSVTPKYRQWGCLPSRSYGGTFGSTSDPKKPGSHSTPPHPSSFQSTGRLLWINLAVLRPLNSDSQLNCHSLRVFSYSLEVMITLSASNLRRDCMAFTCQKMDGDDHGFLNSNNINTKPASTEGYYTHSLHFQDSVFILFWPPLLQSSAFAICLQLVILNTICNQYNVLQLK